MKTLAHNPFVRIAHKSLACILAFCIVNMPVWALEMGDTTITQSAGSAGLTGSGNTVSVDLISNHAVLDWTKMDIGAGKAIDTLAVAGAGSYLLNRVNGSEQAVFNGVLDALGKNIFIVSPNGVIVGPNASITASAFTAAGLNITNDDFTNGIYKFVPFEGGIVGDVTNYATIENVTDQVAFLGKTVLNDGTVSLPSGGVVVMAAGDSIYLGDPGGKIIVEMTGIDEGSVTNTGEIEVPEGKIILAAGDIYSIPLQVESGTGRVGQFGTASVDGIEGDGGQITLTAADVVVLGENSITSANAGDNGDGGDIIVYSPDSALFRKGALVEAKGGIESGNGGFFELSGKQYVETMGSIDLTGTQNGTFLIDPLDLWIVDDVTIDVTEDPAETWKPTNDASVSQLDVDDLETYLDNSNVTLSTLGTPPADGQNGDIIFDYDRELHSGASETSNNSLIVEADHNIEFKAGSSINFEGDGSVELYASTHGDSPDYDGAVIAPKTGKSPYNIKTAKGDIIIEAGSGGIDMGALQIGFENAVGDEAHLRLLTINGNEVTIDYGDENPDLTPDDFDITVQHLNAEGRRYSSVYVKSAGDLTINGESSLGGAVHAKTNTTSTPDNEPAKSFACLIADGDVYIDGKVFSEAESAGQTDAAVWIGAGTNNQYEPGDPRYYEGTVTVFGASKIIQADAKTSADPEVAKADATIRIYGSEINLDGSVESLAKDIKYTKNDPVSADSGYTHENAEYEIDPEEPLSDGSSPMYDKLIKGTRTLLDIDITRDGSCLNCANEIQVIFALLPDADTINWRTGYTIDSINFNPDSLLVLDNDTLPDNVTITSITIIPDGSAKGTVTVVGDTLVYIPPSYDNDTVFYWDGSSQYATFTDTFYYQVEITTEDGSTYLSPESALVTITVQNQVPILAPDSDTIHMNTSADFDLSSLVTDPDGTPGELLDPDNFVGTYGDLTYGIVEGQTPVSGGSILTDTNPGGLPDPLEISGDTITYTPYDGYVTPGGESTTFGYSVTDSSIVDDQAVVVKQTENLDVTVTNTLPSGAVILDDAHMDAVDEELSVDSGSFTDAEDDFIIAGITKADDDDNKTFGGTLVYNGTNDPYNDDVDGTYDYTADGALPGYTGEDDFDAQLWDGQRTYYTDGSSEAVYGSGTIDLEVTNEVPTGAVVLEDAPMNAVDEELAVDSGTFTDSDGDDFAITDITPATDDENKAFGETLDYNGTKDPYAAGDTYNYSADTDIPGYVGEDDFDVQLWDGQIDYTFKQVDGVWVVDTATNVYGSGTIDLELTNELPEGDAWFGQVHMDSQDVGPQDLEVDFGAGVNVSSDTYTGSVIGSDNYGGTLVYDGDTWTYSTDPTLPGYVGDDNDDYGQGGYVADDLFTVNLSSDLGQQYDYWFDEEPAPDGYEFYAPSEIYRKAVSAQGTVSVDITNAPPTIDGTVTIEHMNENIENKVFATDHLDGNPINELDPLSISDTTSPGFGDLTLIDNGDGTYSYTYEPIEGFVGNDSFEITVYDGQRDYVFVDGEIQSNSLVPVQGTVKMEITNIIPYAAGDLGEVTPGDSTRQNDVTSPVFVTDPLDAPQQDILDNLSIVPGIYTLPSGSKLEFKFNGTEWVWIYTPAPGAPENETFTINVWDGQYDYTNIEVRTKVYGEGTVQVSYTSTPPTIPAAPLPLLEIPELKGCPAVMEAAALELAVNSDELQLLIANSMATNPNLQPCDACENLLTAAAALKGINPEMMAAMNAIFNQLAPPDAPFTPEVSASIQTAFASFREMEPQLALMSAEEYEQYQQYAMTDEVIEAFVSYVAVLDNDLKLPVGDTMALVMDKYFGPIETSENPNIGAYILGLIQAAQTAAEPIVASAD
ncbi:MAG: Ig-like domain-containing protein [Phycisphaerae bacterium]|nr:Ig-like domain-containing protein [Phycisphaerae bacterium]